MKRAHLAVHDYGMGGIWCLIEAESAKAIEDRWPGLQVVRVGDPEWITPEKYTEITESWVAPDMRFDFDHPTGWLVESKEILQPS